MTGCLSKMGFDGFRVDRTYPAADPLSGDTLERAAGQIKRRSGIVDVRFTALDTDSRTPLFIAYAERRGTRPDLGYAIHPIDEEVAPASARPSCSIVSRLCSLLSRIAALEPFPSQVFAEVALALRAAHGAAHVPASVRAQRGLTTTMNDLAIRLMNEQLIAGFDTGAIASACGLSARDFRRAFRLTHGVTPMQWGKWRRIELAKKTLAETTKSLAEVAAVCGFPEQVQFVRAFVSFEGVSPRAWRRRVPDRAPLDVAPLHDCTAAV
ncbi:MAG TPA: AraC family transcriptional regulator [Luteibacter sp.]|uniref:helix-turn-helix domain-containing protein n=1 Tax=Luteibacter sp. TaxID=1886636 RepID=UPI002B603E19|nr:AraC family transcriptional regulator [Luteibacter sp.]HVI53673.1 AraC family transcriptional regulator [Luteibacter sp.]